MRHAKPTVPKEPHPFDLGPAAFTSLWNGIALNGIEFHLSPERGGPATPGGPAVVVPAPATLLLMISGVLGMFTASRRRKQTSQV